MTDTYFGERLTDPYRWMENPKDPDWLPFLRDQNARTRGFLDAIPNRARLLTAISARTGDAAVTQSVQKAGEALFIQQRPAGAN
ncbi:hypothetical protein, partial [Streptomyces galilaeus]|uniref:hypothetical protein n=1 Tax=Streptomyces galilaeus TaxID=33899 RepID=UPI0038F69F93